MATLTAISKNQPRGKPFPKGQSGNPIGRPKRTPDEEQLIQACREKTPEALATIDALMRESANDRVRLAAAQFIVERGYGRAPERIELVAKRDEDPRPWSELSPREAYMRLVRGETEDAELEDAPLLPRLDDAETGLEAILASAECEAED